MHIVPSQRLAGWLHGNELGHHIAGVDIDDAVYEARCAEGRRQNISEEMLEDWALYTILSKNLVGKQAVEELPPETAGDLKRFALASEMQSRAFSVLHERLDQVAANSAAMIEQQAAHARETAASLEAGLEHVAAVHQAAEKVAESQTDHAAAIVAVRDQLDSAEAGISGSIASIGKAITSELERGARAHASVGAGVRDATARFAEAQDGTRLAVEKSSESLASALASVALAIHGLGQQFTGQVIAKAVAECVNDAVLAIGDVRDELVRHRTEMAARAEKEILERQSDRLMRGFGIILFLFLFVLFVTRASGQVTTVRGLGTGGAVKVEATSPLGFNLSQVGGTAVSGANVVDVANTAIRVNVVAGAAGGGTAQLAVRNAADAAWVNVGFNAANLRVPTDLGSVGGTAVSGANVVDAGNTAFRVNCVTGCAGSSFADNSAFTFGTSTVANAGAVVDDTATNAVTENSAGAPRMSTNRVLYSNLRNATGTEVVTATTTPGASDLGLVVRNIPSGTQTVSGTVTATPTGTQDVNQTQVNGVAVSTGNGIAGTGVQRVAIASDNTAFSVNVGTFPDNEPINVAQMNGVAVTMGNGVSGTGVQRVTLASDSTGQVTLATGSATIGALTANQSVNTAQIAGTTTLTGNGVTGAGSQRVTIASDNTAFTVNTGTFPDNEPFNLAQAAGNTLLTGNGVTGTGSPRVTIASDNTAFTVNVGTFPDNEPVNVAQMNGVAVTMGNGTAGTGVQRNTIASDNTAIANWGHGATGSAVPSGATQMAGTNGTNLTVPYIDPCEREARTTFSVDIVTATTTVITTATASQRVYVCSLVLFSAGTTNIALVEGTGGTCGTGTAGLAGGATAGEGFNLTAQTGVAHGNGAAYVFATAGTNVDLCLISSAAVQVSGTITWVKEP